MIDIKIYLAMEITLQTKTNMCWAQTKNKIKTKNGVFF